MCYLASKTFISNNLKQIQTIGLVPRLTFATKIKRACYNSLSFYDEYHIFVWVGLGGFTGFSPVTVEEPKILFMLRDHFIAD